MTKSAKGNRGVASRQSRLTPYPMPSCNETEIARENNLPETSEKKDWEDATCSVCMESPHNAVLLLCSSHEKGCRPYMCGTSFRYSNCLDQYNKAYTKVVGPFPHRSVENPESMELITCPLCRGRVKGWTVVEPAREYLNARKRSCTHDGCSFIGTYKKIRKHVRAEHPSSKPREVDPNLEQEWRRLEVERETEDVRSTVRSSVPGAVFQDDYVIEGGHYGNDYYSEGETVFDWDAARGGQGSEVTDESLISMFRMLQAFGSAGNAGPANRGMRSIDDDDEEEDMYNDMTLAGRLYRQGGFMSSRSWRRRRRREANRESNGR